MRVALLPSLPLLLPAPGRLATATERHCLQDTLNSKRPMPDLSPISELFHQLPEGTGKVALLFALAMGIGVLFAIKAPGSIKPEAWMNWDD